MSYYNNNQGKYLWRVTVYACNNRLVPEYTKLFTDKFSAMNYAEKMNSTNLFSSGDYYFKAKIEKWFGD